MYRVMTVGMASAIREISIERGLDPRDFPLVCAGGAGAIHAAMIARELGIARIMVPRVASVLCAAGMLATDLRHDLVRSFATTFADRLDGSPPSRRPGGRDGGGGSCDIGGGERAGRPAQARLCPGPSIRGPIPRGRGPRPKPFDADRHRGDDRSVPCRPRPALRLRPRRRGYPGRACQVSGLPRSA